MMTLRQQVLRIKREHRIDRCRAAIEETIFQTSNRQTRVVCVPRREWTPAGEFHFHGNLGIIKSDSPKRKSALERCLLKPWQTPATAGISAFRAGEKWTQLPGRDRTFKNARDSSCSFNAQGRKDVRLAT